MTARVEEQMTTVCVSRGWSGITPSWVVGENKSQQRKEGEAKRGTIRRRGQGPGAKGATLKKEGAVSRPLVRARAGLKSSLRAASLRAPATSGPAGELTVLLRWAVLEKRFVPVPLQRSRPVSLTLIVSSSQLSAKSILSLLTSPHCPRHRA